MANKQQVLKLIKDEKFVDGIISKTLKDSDLTEDLIKDLVSDLCTEIKKDNGFKKKILDVALKDPNFKKKIIEELIDELD